MTDRHARDLIARALRERTGQDPDAVAADVLHILRGHGWRPTAARPEWQREHGPPAEADAVHDHAAQARAALADELERERLQPTPRKRGEGGEP